MLFVRIYERNLKTYYLDYFVNCRGEYHSLVVGLLTAIPSGAAVAIAILGENIGSLVGVAISASLLPPAVNAVK